MPYFGEFAALLTAIFWTLSAISFEIAGKQIGSLVLNFVRLVLGIVLLSLFTWLYRGLPFPTDAPAEAWLWLSVSGVIGLVLGDWFLFKAFIEIGARISMLIMSLTPLITTLLGWLLLGEVMALPHWIGMVLTLGGIALVILDRQTSDNSKKGKVGFTVKFTGILFAVGGAFGQAGGLIFSKMGLKNYDAFAGTQIRVIAGILGFALVVTLMKRWGNVRLAFSNKAIFLPLSIGSVFGPFLGISFSLLAVMYTQAGIAATLMSIVPVLIIAPAVFLFKEKVTLKEIGGALMAVAGVSFFFLFS